MSALDRVLPTPRLVEVDSVDLAGPPAEIWPVVRHGDLGQRSALVRALFAIRTLPDRLSGARPDPPVLAIEGLRSSADRPGFQILIDEPPHEVVVGAIGQVWQLEIPFVHVDGPAAFAAFDAHDQIKVAWAVRVEPRGVRDTRLTIEVRVDATDDDAWRKFRAYFLVVGIGSRFVRKTLLAGLAAERGTPDAVEASRALPGDTLLPDALGALSHHVDIDAAPAAIWPWLLQMGADRAGWYSIDLLDNDGARSARELHPELQDLRVGQILPATPGARDGFEVLQIVPDRALVLGGLFDAAAERQLPFAAPRPERFWQVTWAFVLEPLDGRTTRLHVRARAAWPATGRLHAAWIRPVHGFMERAQLRGLKARVEGTLARDDARDVLDGLAGIARIGFAILTPFLDGSRARWGTVREDEDRTFPGDELVPTPRWGWTHAVEIAATPAEIWPWIAQLGADRGGFYSYQWLENLTGCEIRNAETIHPEWALSVGDRLVLHPKAPPFEIVGVEPEHALLAFGRADESAKRARRPWSTASWLFLLSPSGPERTRLISRHRVDASDDLATRLAFGPPLVAPIGYAMDRRMLLGVKERVERARARRT